MKLLQLNRRSKIDAARFGARAARLGNLANAGAPITDTILIPADEVKGIATGHTAIASSIFARLGGHSVVAVRSSARDPGLGGPRAVLHVGLTLPWLNAMPNSHLRDLAMEKFLEFVQFYSVHIARLDPDDSLKSTSAGKSPEFRLKAALAAFKEQTGEAFPDSAESQLDAVIRSMARAWDTTTARILRRAKGRKRRCWHGPDHSADGRYNRHR